MLVSEKIPYASHIRKNIKSVSKSINDVRIPVILSKNPYEVLVPLNLWFNNPDYTIVDCYENNQHLRIRYYRSVMLTPLISRDNNLSQFKVFIDSLSIYQPFYPETFYIMWEFQKSGNMAEYQKYLHIGNDYTLGTVESIICNCERYHYNTYQSHIYHVWISDNEDFNTYSANDNTFTTLAPKVDYLGQAYRVKYIESSTDLIKYDFISIDCNHKFTDIFNWESEEKDLQANLFYLMLGIQHLNDRGSMLIRLNMLANQSWNLLFKIILSMFDEYTFFRPSISHNYNSEIYLFLDKFRKKSLDVYHVFLANLYKYRVYELFNISYSKQNLLADKFLIQVTKWSNNLCKPVIKKNINYLDVWHAAHDLKQIKDMNKNFNNNVQQYPLKSTKLPSLKLSSHKLNNIQYKKLLAKRSELNYYKRVMDTKPSRIFTNHHSRDQDNYLLAWEDLCSMTDVYVDLRHTLRECGAEMITNAWLKMHELLCITKDLVFPGAKTFHLCEAPGAFISAINHNVNGKLNWYAQTLKADGALSDHFGLMATYPNRWLFGDDKDNSGNITHSYIIKYYANNPLLKNIDFMTSDAGIQCNPIDLNEQETLLSKINMGQIICILACLSKTKSAIFKTFLPMTEPLTVSLMYLVTNLFTNVSFIKPSTSHGTNSEVYVILRNYKGINQKMLELLYILLDDPKVNSKSLLFSEIDVTFIESYTKSITNLIDKQISSLSFNYYHYYHLDQIPVLEKNEFVNRWLATNPVPKCASRILLNSQTSFTHFDMLTSLF